MEYELAADAFELVSQLPSSAALWATLSKRVNALAPTDKARLVAAIESLPLVDTDTNWLRYSALAYLTQNPHWYQEQSACAGTSTSPDAIINFLGLAWHYGIAKMPGQSEFVQLMQSIQAPRLLELAGRHMPALQEPAQQRKAISRIAVYTPHLMDRRHGSTVFMTNILSALTTAGMECRGFTALEASISEVNAHTGGDAYLRGGEVDTQSLMLNVAGSVQIIIPSSEFSLQYRLKQMQAAVLHYQPDLIIFVGFYSPLVYSLYSHFPVLGLAIHALPPLVPLDLWLSSNSQDDSYKWQALPSSQAFDYPFRFWPQGEAQLSARDRLNVPNSAIVCLTTGFRLHVEMPDPWCQQMLIALELQPHMHWLLVGVDAAQLSPGFVSHERIHCVGPQDTLNSWIAASDIYVNPPRTGGGTAAAMAMEQGLAVLTMIDNDVADKVGQLATNTTDDYFQLLHAWVMDSEKRMQAGQAMQARFASRLDMSCDSAREKLLQACQSTLTAFNHRVSSSNV